MPVWSPNDTWPSLSCPGGDIGCASNTLNYIADVFGNMLLKAEELMDEAQLAMDNLAASGEQSILLINGVGDYNAQTGGVNQTYVPPTKFDAEEPDYYDLVPDAPIPPNVEDGGITPCEIEAAFNRANNKILKSVRGAERDALYAAASAGIGLANPTLLTALRQAGMEGRALRAEAAVAMAEKEGQWRREDRIEIAKVQAEIFAATAKGYADYLDAATNRYRARLEHVNQIIASEAERRQWSEMQLKVILEKEDKRIGYALEKVKAVIATLQTVNDSLAKLYAGLAQGLWSAVDLGMSGSGGYSGSWNESLSTSYSYSGEIAA
jgi:hypothetical protein